MTPSQKPPTLCAPLALSFITFLALPGGWLLGVVSLYRLGLRRKAFWLGVIWVLGAVVLVGLAWVENPSSNSIGARAMAAGAAAYYLTTELLSEIRAYEQAGQSVVYEPVGISVLWALAFSLIWYLLCVCLVAAALMVGEFAPGGPAPTMPGPFLWG